MKLTFIGAVHEVTGSCTLLQACGKNILVDCGQEQGTNVYENIEIPIKPSDIDLVLLTHSHIDHSGNLPLLVKNGFGGSIYATPASAELCGIMLMDSAHIQESEAEWQSRKNQRAGREPVEPAYTQKDAAAAINLLTKAEYGAKIQVCDGIEARFTDAGHLLGSASVEIWITENGATKKLVFSGDIGNINQPIIRDPSYITDADFVVMESTYGNRSHGERPDYIKELSGIIQKTLDRGGNLVIPAFAVGRTQEMLYFIREIKTKNLVRGHDGFKVYVDSPLANEATNIFTENLSDCFDAETEALINKGINPLHFDGLQTSVSSDDSKAINFDEEPKVIISASGMCDAGRIKHHLKHNLWRGECTVLFVGYQANGTLGRVISDGADKVKIFGEEIDVRAEILKLNGVSGHADNEGLMAWARAFKEKPTRIFVNHGDIEACETLSARIQNELKIPSLAPYSGDVWQLETDTQLEKGARKLVEKASGAQTERPVQAAYTQLIAAGKRLEKLLNSANGAPNKDLKKLAARIHEICDAWEK